MFDLVLWHLNHLRLFSAKSIFKYTNSSISNNSVLSYFDNRLTFTMNNLKTFRSQTISISILRWESLDFKNILICSLSLSKYIYIYIHTYWGSDLMKKNMKKYSLWGKEKELPPGNSALRDLERPEKWTTL